MSIEVASQTSTPAMGSDKHKSKSEKKPKSSHSEKKPKSSHGEKKRKRDHTEDEQRSKLKKHRADKTAPESSNIETAETLSPFHLQTSSLFLSLAPISQKYPLQGICAEHLSPLILTYYPPFNGVILSYSNPRLSEKAFRNDGDTTLLQNIDEYAVSWAWVTADFLLFKPEKGAWLEGYVNLQNEGHLGLVCWNLFNASIERKRLPESWRWVGVEEQERGVEGMEMGETYAEDGVGYFVDGEGKKVEGMIKFKVREIETNHDRERGFLSIEGTVLDDEKEMELVEKEKKGFKGGRDNAGRRLGGARALGATSLGVPDENADGDSDIRKHKSRH